MKRTTLPFLLMAVAFTSLGSATARDRVFGIGNADLSVYDTDADGVLSDEELAAAKEAIRAAKVQEKLDEFDSDGDGVLSDEEKAAAREARQAERAAERQAIIDEFDADGDGVLNEEERAAAKEARAAERIAAKETRFAEIDTDASGALSAEEVQVATLASEERLAAILARYDADESGDISLEEFVDPGKSKGGKRGRRHHRRGNDRDGGGDVADEGDAGAGAPAVVQRRRFSRRR